MQAVYCLKRVAQIGEPCAARHGVAIAQLVMVAANVFYTGFPAHAFEDAPADLGTVLAHTGREDQHVQTIWKGLPFGNF